MSKITPFLTYDDQAEAAANLYVSLFENSKIVEANPMTVRFELDGVPYVALNGGPRFQFAEGFSLAVQCETQAEIDKLWGALTEEGGEEGRCGWLKDRFGVSWQIVPATLGRLLGDPDRAKAQRALQAMLAMKKLDIAELERAFEGE